MIVGVPTETKTDEYRVAITPAGVMELAAHGHRVLVERGAGEGSSIPDVEFEDAGAEMVSADDVFESSELIVKVKEPKLTEIDQMSEGQALFTFLHIAAYPEMGAALVKSGVTAFAYETVELPNGSLPLLAPMSEIAGRLATQAGAHHLERPRGGRGVLLGGVPGVPPARVVVIGAGRAGTNAAMIAAGMGAEVVVLDLNVDRLRHIDELQLGRVITMRSSRHAIEQYLATADLVVGAVLVPGDRAPVVVTEEHIAKMRPGTVVVDISIDQGGCIATARETTHAEPTYVVGDVIHYAVGNIPGAVPNTSTNALTNATLPYVVAIADGITDAMERYPELVPGLECARGAVTNAVIAELLGMELADPMEAVRR